jgi:hypothetical protein
LFFFQIEKKMSSKDRISFGYKRINSRRNNLKSTPTEFLDHEDEQYIDFSQQNIPINRKRTRE